MLSAGNIPVLFLGLQLPAILPADPALHATLRIWHTYLALAFFALVMMHLAAALFHALVRKDGVFRSMAP
jgi:cytochrome b561